MGQQLLRVGAPCCKFSRALARTQTSARTQARAVPSSQESCLPLRRSLKPVLTTSLCGSSAEAFHSRRLLARQQRRSLSVTAAVSADAEPVSTSRVANKDGFANRQRIKDIKIEVAVDTLELIGACDSATYPLQKKEDMEFFDKFNEKGLIDRLTAVAEKDFATMTYTEVGSSF
ncbi:hypothetical protein CYMTET_23133 [Cymbomonas tetramitiformis]|uniref:Uncharacterized protein n=1 Tax=Cymbomonas tetramitiformis TaxID=36881 RepID=A0AAE0FYI9_9CHLO|nr:hypothetical protein CYMTET_23133 [Cymbomonas tetramitiformis]